MMVRSPQLLLQLLLALASLSSSCSAFAPVVKRFATTSTTTSLGMSSQAKPTSKKASGSNANDYDSELIRNFSIIAHIDHGMCVYWIVVILMFWMLTLTNYFSRQINTGRSLVGNHRDGRNTRHGGTTLGQYGYRTRTRHYDQTTGSPGEIHFSGRRQNLHTQLDWYARACGFLLWGVEEFGGVWRGPACCG